VVEALVGICARWRQRNSGARTTSDYDDFSDITHNGDVVTHANTDVIIAGPDEQEQRVSWRICEFYGAAHIDAGVVAGRLCIAVPASTCVCV
jgi:hypothetical protein